MTRDAPRGIPRRRSLWQALLPWLVTATCFTYLYFQVERQANEQGTTAPLLLADVFTRVDWRHWLSLMMPYSALFFLVDSLIVWRVVNWFNARVPYAGVLPVRASAYIISILNEEVGKGAMALYLHRRDGVPVLQVGSSMLFIVFCEFYYLLAWATLGTLLQRNDADPIFQWIPWIAGLASGVLALWLLFFSGRLLPGSALRDRAILLAFRRAGLSNYLVILLLRSPLLLAAVFVYAQSLALFGQETTYLEMLGYLPVVFFATAIPGPLRAVAVAMWPALHPDRAAEMAAFGLVQHNFFIFFNAAIGLLFLRRANRELFAAKGP